MRKKKKKGKTGKKKKSSSTAKSTTKKKTAKSGSASDSAKKEKAATESNNTATPENTPESVDTTKRKADNLESVDTTKRKPSESCPAPASDASGTPHQQEQPDEASATESKPVIDPATKPADTPQGMPFTEVSPAEQNGETGANTQNTVPSDKNAPSQPAASDK